MANGLFENVYSESYRRPSSKIYWVPLALMSFFLIIVTAMCFMKTDKVVATDGYILPKGAYLAKLPQRGFIVENQTKIGRWVKQGDTLAAVQFDNGSIKVITAAHDGYVIDTDLKDVVEGPLEEGTLIASIVDPQDLRLKVDLPAQQRGTVKSGTRVRYKFDTFTRSERSTVEQYYITMLPDGQVNYQVYSLLAKNHRQINYVGKRIPVKLIIENISLIDYFLSE